MKSFLLFFIFISGCAAPMNVPLTPEGAKVSFIGYELVDKLPGKPMDRCKIAGHLKENIQPRINTAAILFAGTNPAPVCTLQQDDLKRSLLNAAARVGGNVAMFTTYSYATSGPGSCPSEISGVALSCDDATLKAAGLAK